MLNFGAVTAKKAALLRLTGGGGDVILYLGIFDTGENMDEKLKAVVLAAGKGKRLGSEAAQLPKSMREAGGRPLLAWVLDALAFIPERDIVLVLGYMKETILERFPDYPWVEQREQLGTGHAANCAREPLAGYHGDVIVICGDTPMIRRSTLMYLAQEHQEWGNDCTMLTCSVAGPEGLGRIIRDNGGRFTGIVEQRDCTPEQLQIKEINTGIYIFRADKLFARLEEVGCDNSQHEYYLTDVPKLMLAHGERVGTVAVADEDEVMGVNTEAELAHVNRIAAGRRA